MNWMRILFLYAIFFILTAAIPALADEPVYTWTLEEVMKIALDNNPDLKSAKASYEAAAKRVGQAVSGYLPHVDLNAKLEETTLPNPSALSTYQVGVALPYPAFTVSLNQVVFDFGKTLNKIYAESASREAMEQEALALQNAIKLAVQKAFYDVLLAAHLVDVTQESLDRYNEILRRTEVLVRTGAKPSFDLSQARVEVGKAKLALINAQNYGDLAKVTLLNLIGMEEQIPFALKEPPTQAMIRSEKLKISYLIQQAIAFRPEMKRQEFSFAAAHFNYSSEVRNYFPTFSVQGWYGRYPPNYPSALENSWGVSVLGTWHIFQGLETTYRAGELSAKEDQQRALVQKGRLDVVAEVTRGYKDYNRAEQNLGVATDALDAAKENVRLAKKRYEANVATILELLVAQGSLLNAEETAIRARFEEEIAFATLRRVVNAPLMEGGA